MSLPAERSDHVQKLEFLKRLDDAKVHYFIDRCHPDTIDITATIVGERIEITILDDEHIEISCFLGNEEILDEEVLDGILKDKG